ncbi:MAG: hypothetical protein ACUVQU_03685 [Candidatus Bipolaricaulia bacterium]
MEFKVVLDSDGLIKLAKAEVLEAVAKVWTCVIPRAVYEETVERGKKAAYPDATRIEQINQAHHIPCKRASVHPQVKKILRGVKSLGAGEREALHLFFEEGADAIVSDDARFLPLLEQGGVSYLPPALVLVQLARRKEISKDASLAHLERMKPLIKPGAYRRAKEDLEKVEIEPKKEEQGR